MLPNKDNTNPKDLDESIQHTNLRLDELILANHNLESVMEHENQTLAKQIGELDNNFTARMQAGFADLSTLFT